MKKKISSSTLNLICMHMKMCKIETKVHNNSGLYGMCGLNLLVLYSAVEFFFFSNDIPTTSNQFD